MAQKVIYQLIDDLDQSPLGEGDGETVIFGLDGVDYEIDLSAAHAGELREALGRYVAAGRKRSGRSSASAGTTGTPARRGTAVKRDLESVRAWANENGFTVSTRGRIPAAVSEAYHAAH
ncbi:Lsr2 family protein [Leifsonia sp. NPDC058292]|uniref:histone-like nucleoid-structuring protein Lsr2 n=1 Tax=Leifsonia sp. NPDC058292 TaxID=3346428 RepID=UPI0036DDE166